MAKRRREERAARRRKQQQQQFIVGASIVGVVILVGALAYYLISNREASFPDEILTAYEGFDQSMAGEGYAGVLGSPDAPIEVREFSSFLCPACLNLQSDIERLHPYIEEGQVRLVFIPIWNIAGPAADPSARAAICAGQQDKFFEMHDVMFYWQGRESYGGGQIESAADQLGLDTDEFSDCFDSSDTRQLVRQGRAEFDGFGFTGTPSVLVNGQRSNNVIGDVEALLN